MQTPNGKPLSGKRLLTMFALITLLAIISIGASYARVFPCTAQGAAAPWSPPPTCPTCCGYKLENTPYVYGCDGGTSHTTDCVTYTSSDYVYYGCGQCSPVTGLCTDINWVYQGYATNYNSAGLQGDPNCE